MWEAWLNATVHHPGYTGIVASPSFALLSQAWLAEWVHWFEPFSGLWELKRNSKDGDRIVLGNGSSILLRSTSVPHSNEGVNAAWLVFDEASRERTHDSYRVLRGRVRRGYPGRRRSIILTGPPSTRTHWTAKEFGTGPCIVGNTVFAGNHSYWYSDTTAVIRARTRDNPMLPETYERDLRASPGATESWCRQYLDAEFGQGEGAVWPQFSRDKHVIGKCPEKFRRVVCGVDWGWTHPGSMIVIGQTGDGMAYVIAERVFREKLVSDSADGWVSIARELVRDFGVTEFYCDPSQPGSMSALAKGLLGRARIYDANNDVAEGIRAVGARFERNTLLVSEACPKLIGEIEGYGRKRFRDGSLSEDPQDIDDDACDGLRYAVKALRN